ncbi:uncharacterized protein F4822DRAFT_438396 [Hypoxylon trugodes]|uniref:uncharacterized protein n=1 Tax=Hypoxylon trugodes TaxID=326681 RepID=UPI002199FAC3|nr:uncharacterized protein F4822DRAFT_438396 [Hypoxylon trugodes]KAI1386008.1 hypothetical protein F4822DRAFT_438396 [Hypoxylon trugodes]
MSIGIHASSYEAFWVDLTGSFTCNCPLTCSPPSSYQGSVWSPVQTDVASEVTATGTVRSRVPSPLRNATGITFGVDCQHVCFKDNCDAKFANKEDFELHSRVGHLHICLWGDNGPCDSAGFATREELNWHVKREHLLLCPVLGCAEGAFASKDLLDCHLKCAHGSTAADKDNFPRPSSLLNPADIPAGASTKSAQKQVSSMKSAVDEDKALKMEMSIGISKKRCREQLRAVLERRMKRANGNTPKTTDSPGAITYRTPKPLESASFPVIWEHGVLPFLVEFIPKWCGPGHMISVARWRKPNSRRICIMTKQPVSRARRLLIAEHVRDLLPETYRNLVVFAFSTGKVERLVWARGLGKEMPDEICQPRNPFCYVNPCMGDSIGTTSEDGDEATATLGPLITIDGGSYWLVSFHPFVDLSKGVHPVTVEHPSPADRKECVSKGHDILSSIISDFKIGDLTATSGFDLKTTRVSHDPYWEDCDKEPPLVVTDWALIPARSRQANLLRKFPATNQRREHPITSMGSVVPERTVCSTGRTSGFQRGQVCEIPAYLDGSENGTGRASREWYIEEPYPYDNENEWIRSGIGVEGDSGAAIVDCESNAIIGQLWGRNKYYGPGPRHTFFTPIFDIFDDIQERCGQEQRARLPQFRDEADCWPTYPICKQCFDLGEYLESRRSSGASLVSMIGVGEAGAGEFDNDLTSVSELATPKDQSHLVRHIGPDEVTTSFGSPAPIHAFYSLSQAMSPGNSELRSPYAQALNDEDLYERCADANENAFGKRPAFPTPMARSGSQQMAKRRRLE